MNPFSISIPLKIDKSYSLNSKTHWAIKAAQKQDIEAFTVAALMNAKINRRAKIGRLELTFYWDSPLDLDNHASIRKAVIDAIKNYFGTDDNAYCLGEIHEKFWPGREIKVDIKERDDMSFPSLRGGQKLIPERIKSKIKRRI